MPTAVNLELAFQTLRAWKCTAPIRLRVLSGRLWVTQTNDLQDHFLDPGDCTVFVGPDVLIQAETDARCMLEPLEACPAACPAGSGHRSAPSTSLATDSSLLRCGLSHENWQPLHR